MGDTSTQMKAKADESVVQSLKSAQGTLELPPQKAERQEALVTGDAPLAKDRVTLEQVREHPHVQHYIRAANRHLKLLGFTEHGERHVKLVSSIASNVLSHLSFSERQVELAAIAGFLHDIGNVVNRSAHGQIGALMAKDILLDLGMNIGEIALIMGAIGNHEEARGHATSPIAAALILADKADVHRSRVQDPNTDSNFDIPDRVNYAVTESFLRVEPDKCRITLELAIDTNIASVMDYFEISLARMVMCRTASEFLGCTFRLDVNEQHLM